MDYSIFQALPLRNSTDDEPKLKAALTSIESTEWLNSIIEEFDNLVKLKTWEDVGPPPLGTKVLPAGIILKLRRDANGLPDRFKARLVARVNFKEDLFDFGELYVPVACIETVRVLLAVPSAKGLCAEHLDIKGAFLYASLTSTDPI